MFVRAALAAFASACIAAASTSSTAWKVIADSIHTALATCRNTSSSTARVSRSTQEFGAMTISTFDTLILVTLCVLSHRILVTCGRSHAAFTVGIHACITTALTTLSAAKQIIFIVLAARARRAAISATFILRRAPENIVLRVEARLCALRFHNTLQ